MMYKTAVGSFQVGAAFSAPAANIAYFSTLDKGTARLEFRIQDDQGQPLPLSGVKPKLALQMGDKSTFIHDNVEILDPIEGILEYVLSDDEIKHYGQASGELYLVYDDSRQASVHKFSFKIDRALIDESVDVIQEYYVKDFELFKKALEDKLAATNAAIDEAKAEIAATVKTATTNVNNTAAAATKSINDTATAAKNSVTTTANTAKTDVTNTANSAKTSITSTKTAAENSIAAAVDDGESALATAAAAAKTDVTNTANSAKSSITSTKTAAEKSIADATDEGESALATAAATAKTDVTNTANSAKSSITSTKTAAESSIAAAKTAAEKSIADATDEGESALATAAAAAKTDVTNTANSAKSSITSTKTAAESSVNTTAAAAKKSVEEAQDALATAKTDVTNTANSAKSSITSTKTSAESSINTTKTQATTAINDLVATAQGSIKTVSDQVAAAQSNINDILAAIRNNQLVKKTGDTMTGPLSFNVTDPTPINVKRTGNASNANMKFEHDGAAGFIGIDKSGQWKIITGTDANLDGAAAAKFLETTEGSQNKANKAETNAKNWVQGYGLGTASISIDWNTVRLSGFYYSNVNGPLGGTTVFGVHIQHGSNYAMQMAGRLGRTFQRTLENGTWRDWVELETTAGAQAKVNALKNELLKDLTWYDLPLVNGAQIYSEAERPMYAIDGKTVWLKGAVKGVTGPLFTVATLPNGFRPQNQDHTFAQSTSFDGYKATVVRWKLETGTGNLYVHRNSMDKYDSGQWYPIGTSFRIDN